MLSDGTERTLTSALSSAGRVPLSDLKGKMDKVIATESVTAITGKEAKVPFAGRPFTCCIHSDLPGAVEAITFARAAVDEAEVVA